MLKVTVLNNTFGAIRDYNKAGPRANGPQNCLRALKINTRRAHMALKFWGDSNTITSPINEIRRSGPFKDWEGPQKYDIKGPNDPIFTYELYYYL